MVAGKVKSVMGVQTSPLNPKSKPDSSPKPSLLSSTPNSSKTEKGSSSSLSRFRVYFPRASAQVQPRPPDVTVTELLRIVELLREKESRLKTELLEHKLLKETVAIVPVLENQILSKDSEIERYRRKLECLETESEKLREENEFLHVELTKQNRKYEAKINEMEVELSEIKRALLDRQQLDEASMNAGPKLIDVTNNSNYYYNKNNLNAKCLKKCATQSYSSNVHMKNESVVVNNTERQLHSRCDTEGLVGIRSRVPRIPKPPPRPSPSSSSLSSVSSPCYGSLPESADCALAEISNVPCPPPPPPPPPPVKTSIPPPPPPPPSKGLKLVPSKVRKVPEVVEFYHSLMRRESNCRRDCSGGSGNAADVQAAGANAKDMIGEIENRSTHLLAIKTDVETQGDFIRFLIKEVEDAAFTDIEDVVTFVKWLDDELSYLVDERAVLKHFDWPEKKADALREAAFGYSDFKKLEFEASSFRDDPRQHCGPALKKMQSLFEKLEHGVYNLSRMRESATIRYKVFQIPMNWMMDTGYVSQIKLASVKLAIKYMKRVLAELEMVVGGPEEEELIVQGVKYAFRVHQFAGGFDVETMKTFQELRDKAQMPKSKSTEICL